MLGLVGTVVFGQPPTPLADPVGQQLLPSGISRLPVDLNGKLVYIFKDADGVDALHFVGEFLLTVGNGKGQTLRAREAAVWITHRAHQGRPYYRLEILLWKDAEIQEVGGTFTSGPALFATLNTFGQLKAHADDVAFQSSADSRIYLEGNAIRQAIAKGAPLVQEEDVHLRVLDASGLTEHERVVKPRPLIHVRSEGELTISDLEDGRQVLVVSGGVYLSRGVPAEGEYQEIQADSVVIFLPPSGRRLRAPKPEAVGLGTDTRQPPPGAAGPPPGGLDEGRAPGDRQRLSTGLGEVEVEAAYLEGDVLMRQGPNMVRASRLYYDFLRDRALILDAVVHTALVERNIPLYVRAAEIRQVSRNHFTASDAMFTTSEFHTPHYHVGAGRVDLIDRTPPDLTGRRQGLRAGTFSIRHATLNLDGHPIVYWPYIRGNIDTSETSIRNVRGGYDDDFGVEIETDFDLFNVLGLETPEGLESMLSLDYFSKRGPAVGVDAEYKRDRYFGLLRSYLLIDSDVDFLGREREEEPERDVRGRFLLRHRQYLEDDWQISLELSYISDRGFLEEYFETEFDNEKEQETLLYLKKQRENRAFTAAVQSRLLDFTTQTERLPDFGLHLAGEPLGDRWTWFSEDRLGIVRYRPADQTFWELLRNGGMVGSGSVARVDSRQEVGAPIDAGPVRLVPFVTVRGTAWDDSPVGGGVLRAFGTYGVRGSMYLSRTYPDARSSLFDIHGVRHIIKPDIVAWIAHTNRDSHELFPFDETVEGIDEVDGFALGIRQRWQTKRGGGEAYRTVDFLTFDVELGLFNDAESDEITNGFISYSRPENSISKNYLNSSLIWRVNDRTALLSELNYDLNDGEVDILNVSLAVERSPRFSYLLGYRLIEQSDSELLGFDLNYRLNEKHTLALREAFDLARGRSLDFTVALIRKFSRWFGAISFALDEPEDDFGVSVSVWPEGLPGATLGSRRFTELATTTRLDRD
ncbi:MAG: LPS assembly protein LptD [Phycisphaerales bacterium]|nr:MAG: LPS assembly protein LptD [Phycisphaerales bacterium]